MGSAAEFTDPTTGAEKHHHQPIQVEDEDEHVVELERKASSFRHGKRLDSADSSTLTNISSSSSFSGDGSPDFRNGEGEHIAIEDLEVPESPEQVTDVGGFHEEHGDGNNCNVYFDGEQDSESAGVEPDAHESQTADRLNGEKKQQESDNVSTSEDNKETREIEEVQDGEISKGPDQPPGDVIVEERETKDVEDYDVEKVLKNQQTHDLFCPNCKSCITERVVLQRRKRKIPPVLDDPPSLTRPRPNDDPVLRSGDNLPPADGDENSIHESFFYKCLSCFSIFLPTGVDSKPIPPSESVEVLKTQPKPQEKATGVSNWFSPMFGGVKKKEPAVQQGGAIPSVPATSSSTAPALVQDVAGASIQDSSVSQVKGPVDTPSIPVAKSDDASKVVNNGATVENEQKFLVPSAEEQQTQQKMKKDDANAADRNHSSDKGRLSPIHPSHDMNISNTVTSGPDGVVRVETIFHAEGVSHLFEGTDTGKLDFGLGKVTGAMDTGDRGVITGTPSPVIDMPPLPVSSLEEGTLREPLVVRPVGEGRTVEILKSIVYGGLIESITSLGVISSAAGSGASTLNILVLGLANLFGGLILLIHNLQELRDEEPRRTTTENNQTNGQEEGRYKRLLGRRENFTIHAIVAVLSFIIAGLLPPVVYYFSFSKTHNRNYKVASVFGSALVCIVLLALAKAHVKSPRGSHLKSALYYTMIAVSVSGISYVVGDFVDQLLERYGWSDGSETPAGEMLLSLMGRKAGSFGYSSSSY
ncbi:hypothetical protein EUTSA_v10024497mg [Eutrema salsugineum]|uniref:Membrane protein of ER body-like protein n=1 Tax=Eutrema salsugineum TaxID=72664 RepID=V4P4P7_EUTSA|nr:membrane protein of ER body-like protein isoform X2 [Eutrema salsugineum]ESQ54471.1 hypothetical protein EUTSA_v10024497mg [Eutrema salsugineum]